MKLSFLIGCLVAASALTVLAQETPSASVAARASVERAAAALLKSTVESDTPWFVPPRVQRTVVDRKEVQVRYSKKVVEVPVWEYETVKVHRNVREGDSAMTTTTREEVTIRRPVRQIGTRKEERLVPDPNGTEYKTERRPVYGPGGPDLWRHGNYALNGLALYSLVRGGADPAANPVAGVSQSLLSVVNNYGLPDGTIDLAGIVLGLSSVPDSLARDLAQQAASKLLDGQIADGPAAGLWGPVSINTRLYAIGLEERTRLSALYAKAKTDHAKSKSATTERQMTDIQLQLQNLDAHLKRIAMASQSSRVSSGGITIGQDGSDDKISVPAPPHYVFNQTSADLENTAWAVLALRVAAEKGTLPKQAWRPAGPPWQQVPAPALDGVANRALRALVAAQQADGRWSELNQHQPVTDFHRVTGLEGVPAKANTFVALPSETTPLTTLQGYATLHHLGALLRNAATLAPRRLAAETALAPTVDQLGTVTPAATGGLTPPYEALFWLHNITWRDTTADAALRARLQEWLVNEQDDAGLWAIGRRNVRWLPTSVRERIKVLPVAPAGGGRGNREPFDRAQAHALFSADNRHAQLLTNRFGYEPGTLPTVFALSFLSAPTP